MNISEERLRELITHSKPLRFDWENKWLRGDQYAHMLNNIDAYREAFGMHKMAEKQHPENIYLEPLSKSPSPRLCAGQIGQLCFISLSITPAFLLQLKDHFIISSEAAFFFT